MTCPLDRHKTNDDGKADGKDIELISKMIMEEREENQ